MVKDQDSLRETIMRVIKYLQDKIELEAVILFGSYVNGAPHDFSDIDLAIISSDFRQRPLEEKAKLFSDVKLHCDLNVEVHMFSPDELAEARQTNFLGHVVKHGKFYMKHKTLVA